MFSTRLHWDLRPNRLSELLQDRRGRGEPVLDLSESNPTRVGLEYPAGILAALADPRALTYDPSPAGLGSAREAVAAYYEARGVCVAPDRILLTASTSEAYAYLLKLLADPGDEVLVPKPSYPLFEFLAAMESVRVVQYPLIRAGRWSVDLEGLEAAIGPRTRAIVVVNPNNPTGSFLKRDELPVLASLCANHGLALISDEVFGDYAFADDAARVSTLATHADCLTFSLSGLSKVCGLPQMKLGWMVAGGPAQSTALERLELIADTYLSVGTPVQHAAARLLDAGTTVRDQIRARTAANLAFLRAQLPGAPATLLDVEGGWSAILQVPRTRTEEQWACELLGRQGVLVQPGFFFDFATEAHLVLSLLPAPTVFHDGVRRLLAAIQ